MQTGYVAEALRRRTYWMLAGLALASVAALQIEASTQDKSGFPEGFDAVQVAAYSHRVIYENTLVRVLEVTIPPTGKTEPMHHHGWPSFFLGWDTGARTPHIRYHRPDGTVRDSPSVDKPVVAGHWTVQWMQPEPMHAIEAVDNTTPAGQPPLLRVEIKISS
jgi:hypothetical protein